MEEDEVEIDIPMDDSDEDPDYDIGDVLQVYSGSEEEDDEIDDDLPSSSVIVDPRDLQNQGDIPDFFYGKHGFKWSAAEPLRTTRTPQHNIIRGMPGMRGKVKNLGPVPTFENLWSLLIDQEIIEEVTIWTNVKLEIARSKVQDQQKSNFRATDKMEIRALLALFILSSIFKSNKESILSLFSTDSTGRHIFRAVMSVIRFQILLVCLRFDDGTTREARKRVDPAAAITDIFNRFVENCQEDYSLSEYACIDEMLLPFHVRCIFRVYMLNKPNKYL